MIGFERRISVVAEDSPEVFLRLTGLLARRGRFREMSLGRTMRPGVARYTLVLPGDAGRPNRRSAGCERSSTSFTLRT